jgi:hypothetical protein
MPIATRSYEFPDFGAYGGATYGKTAMALSTLEAIVGAERFHAAMKVYAQTWAFKHPTEADLWDTLERELGEDLDWFVEPAFHDIGAADLRIRDHRCRKAHDPRGVFGRGEDRELVTRDDAPDGDTWICEVLLTNVGTVPVVVDIDVRFDDGSVAHERWDGRDGGTWKRLIFEHTAKIAEVLIDPDKVIAINDNAGARGERAEPDTSASRRAGARVQFWTQSAMQVVGL